MDLTGPVPGENVDRGADRLQALAANTLYTSIVAGVATAVLILGEVVPVAETLVTCTSVGAVVLVGTNGALILSRVYRETKWRTNRARTGESRRAAKAPDLNSNTDS